MRQIRDQVREERLKFKKGMQSEFIKQIKRGSGLTWERLASLVNISEHTIRVDWKTEHSTIPVSYAQSLLDKFHFERWDVIMDKWVEKVLPLNWGQKIIGEKNKKIIVIPEKSEELAELFGVILGTVI